jgi:hypothetical protein
MKKIIQKIYCLGSIVIAFTLFQSCTERIDIDLDSTDVRCVIYGELTTDTTAHLVKVTRSADYFTNKPAEPISGAIISITDGTNIFPLTESSTQPGNYFTDSDVYGVPGNTYTLSVDNVNLLGDGNLHSYSATSELKPVTKIDSIDAVFNKFWEAWEIKAWALDPVESEDYYMFKVSINDVLNADSLTNLVVVEDKFFNGSYTNGITVYFIEDRDTIKTDDRIRVDICGINEDYYKFIVEAQTIVGPQIPMFSGPPANIRTNLSNKAIGYFVAYSKKSSNCIVK